MYSSLHILQLVVLQTVRQIPFVLQGEGREDDAISGIAHFLAVADAISATGFSAVVLIIFLTGYFTFGLTSVIDL